MTGYGQFCPVAKTSELLSERWMPLILRELMVGSKRFGEIRNGIPTISTAMLAKRLRQLEGAGVVERTPTGHGADYTLTDAGWELSPIIEAMGVWGQRWARSDYGVDELDPALLMWDVRRMIQPEGLGDGQTVVEFGFRRAPAGKSRYWLVVDGSIDLCLVDPGHEVDLWVKADLRALTQVWMGDRTMRQEIAGGAIELTGPRPLVRRFPDWFGRHPVLGGVESARC
ncbi:MAG TPA: helix-turn-helix domain-containing protein [Nocardioides sp.]|nr:helix-turn-helix domain-containing protein [Nocardioides sp.]